ncbi:MAG: tRNA (adenosine(37)-N6)-threonylcarbamoyltransferase complex ATPase subunit type 1 TsaE [Gemmatimonadota bacterium]
MGSALVDEGQLAAWGAEFAGALRPPVVVGISGELGAGKTTLVRAIAAALGVAEPVTSPTFALVHRYAGRGVTVYHVDAYRIQRPEDAADLGFEDMLAERDTVVLIEWPERLGAASPALTHRIALSHPGPAGRRRLEYP